MPIKTKQLKNMKAVLPNEPPKIEVPDHLPPLHGLFGYFGVRGSGKTVSMTTLLRKYRDANLAQRVFLISPTYDSNKYLFEGLVDKKDVYEEASQASLDAVMEAIESEAAEWRKWQDHCILWDEYKKQERAYIAGKRKAIDAELVNEYIHCGLADMDRRPTYKYDNVAHPVMHLVIDDCMSSALFNPSSKTKNNLNNLLIKHRHLADRFGVTIHIAMQAWKSNVGVLGRALRSNLTCIILWGLKDRKLMQDIHQEIGREIDKEQFYEAYDYATSGEKWNALVIEFGSNFRMRRNWDTVIFVENEKQFSKVQGNDGNQTAHGHPAELDQGHGGGQQGPAHGLC